MIRLLILLAATASLAAAQVRVTVDADLGLARLGGAAGTVSGSAHGDALGAAVRVAQGAWTVSGRLARGVVDGGAIGTGALLVERAVTPAVHVGGGLLYFAVPGGAPTTHWGGFGPVLTVQVPLAGTRLGLEGSLGFTPIGGLSGGGDFRTLTQLRGGITVRVPGTAALGLVTYTMSHGAAQGFANTIETAQIGVRWTL